MGWNSWDSYGTTITEQEVLDNARFMAEHLKDTGWDTLVIDAGWFDPNAHAHGYSDGTPLCIDAYGRQIPDEQRFPSAADGKGFGPLADAVHRLGLKLGVHVMRGIPRQAVHENLPVKGTALHAQDVADTEHTCAWNHDNYGLKRGDAGAQAWYDAQVDLLASWGLDFLKVDDMQTPFFPEEIEAYHHAIERAEATYGRQITLSLSPGGWVASTHVDFLRGVSQMWRISDDLWDRWEDIYQQFPRLARWAPMQRTGHWADADMLPLGHIGLRAERGDDRQSKLTRDEQKTLLTLWSMGRSPLMVGGDLPTSNADTIALLANPALREVTAGSSGNREIVRERLFAEWNVASSSHGPPTRPTGPTVPRRHMRAATTARSSGPAANRTSSRATSSCKASSASTNATRTGRSPICGPTLRNRPTASDRTSASKAKARTASSAAPSLRTAASGSRSTEPV